MIKHNLTTIIGALRPTRARRARTEHTPAGNHPAMKSAGTRRIILAAAGLAGAALTGRTQTAPDAAGGVVEMDAMIVTTGTRTMHRLGDSPVRTELLTAGELGRAGARSLADSIELLPGCRVENNCQNCGTSDLLMLGLEGKYTAVLFDSVPLFSGLAAVYGLDQIPAAFIDRIEVVKGGGSAIYGSGAVGGVVNIIGRAPARSGGLLEFRHDSVKGRPTSQASAVLDQVDEAAGRALTVYGQAARTEPVDLNHDGFSDLTKRNLQVLGLRLSQKLGRGTLRADYNRTVEFRRGGNKFELPDNLADISERIDTSRDAGSVTWAATVSPDFDYQVSAGTAYISRETFYGGLFGRAADEPLTPESAPGAGDNDQTFLDRGYATHGQVAQDQFGFTKNRVWNLDSQFNFRRGDHHTSIGAQYYREKIDDIVPVSSFVAGFPVPPEVATGDSFGLFIQDDWHPAETWEIVLGVRGDKNSELDGVVVSPRVNVKWAPSGALTLRATFGTGFRAPQPFDEDLHIELIAGERARTIQAADLREERSWSSLLSATWNPEAAQGRMTLEATAFYTRLQGTFTNSEIQSDPVTGEAFRTRFNGPGAEVGGVELNLGALPRPDLRLDLGYVAQFARFRSPVVLFDDDAGAIVAERDFLETPRHYGVLQAAWTQRDAGSLVVSAIYTGPMKEINLRTGALNPRTDRFLVWNVTATRVFRRAGWPDTTLTVGVKNAFDSRQKDLEAGTDRDPYYLYGPRTPRTVFASMRFSF